MVCFMVNIMFGLWLDMVCGPKLRDDLSGSFTRSSVQPKYSTFGK